MADRGGVWGGNDSSRVCEHFSRYDRRAEKKNIDRFFDGVGHDHGQNGGDSCKNCRPPCTPTNQNGGGTQNEPRGLGNGYQPKRRRILEHLPIQKHEENSRAAPHTPCHAKFRRGGFVQPPTYPLTRKCPP